jgi:hypothetical protein
MGIDGIGKPPPIGPAGAPLGPTATSPTTSQFEVGATAQVKPSGELGRLERGEIGLETYLDGKVSEATQHLAGKLSPDQLAFIRETLRGELASDPVLVELVRRTTGKSPEPARE